VHQIGGYPSPTDSILVKATIRGIRRTLGSAARHQKAAITAKAIGAMLDSCDDSLLGRRDRALIVLCFAAALRRSELVALQVEDLSFNEKGMDVQIRRSKGDQEGKRTTLPVLHGAHLFPVAAVKGWIGAAELTTGPLFRHVKKGSRPRAAMCIRSEDTRARPTASW
jgi:integrase